MRHIAAAGLVVIMAIAAGGCGDSALDAQDLLLSKRPIQAKNPDPARLAQATGDKLQPYITCMNRVFRSVDDSRSRYLSWIKDPKVGPTCKERYLYGPRMLFTTSYCTTALQKANALLPKMPELETAAAGVAKAITALDPLVREANRYYLTKAYKSDDCQKGKALHPKLMAAFADYDKSSGAMTAQVRERNEKVLRAALTAIETRYGTSHPRYFHRRISLDARSVLNLLRAQTFDKTNKPGMPKVSAAVSAFGGLVERMLAGSTAAAAGAGYISFRLASKSFLDACKEYVDKRAGGAPKYSRVERRWLSKSSTAWLVPGSYGRALRRFNELIRKSNAVTFR